MSNSFGTPSRRVVGGAAATVLIPLILTGAVRADVTVVMKSETTGGGMRAAMPRKTSDAEAKVKEVTTTSYFAGHKMRIDSGSKVTLMDTDKGIIYVLDPATKTYLSRGGMVDNLASAMPRLSAMMDIKTTASVAQTGKTRVIAGLPAREYTYTATITVGFKSGAFSHVPNGAGKAAVPAGVSNPAASMPMMTVNVRGDQWVTNIASLPDTRGAALSEGFAKISGSFPGMKPLLDKLQSIKGFQLASHQSVTMTGMGMMGGGAASGAAPKPIMTVSQEATSVKQGPLSPSLFDVPADYRRVSSPTMPGMPKGGSGAELPQK